MSQEEKVSDKFEDFLELVNKDNSLPKTIGKIINMEANCSLLA